MNVLSLKSKLFFGVLIVVPLLVSGCAKKDQAVSVEPSSQDPSLLKTQTQQSVPVDVNGKEQDTANEKSDKGEEAGEIDTQKSVEETSARVIEVVAKRWEFLPGVITVKKGEKVRLNIISVDVAHGFALSAFGVSQPLVPGQMTVVEFVADKAGTFNFFCSVYCGEGHGGMTGTLVVED